MNIGIGLGLVLWLDCNKAPVAPVAA